MYYSIIHNKQTNEDNSFTDLNFFELKKIYYKVNKFNK
jgi:hypothetical protein